MARFLPGDREVNLNATCRVGQLSEVVGRLPAGFRRLERFLVTTDLGRALPPDFDFRGECALFRDVGRGVEQRLLEAGDILACQDVKRRPARLALATNDFTLIVMPDEQRTGQAFHARPRLELLEEADLLAQ